MNVSFGNLIRATARDQRVDLSDPPALSATTRPTRVARASTRQLRQYLPQAGARVRHHLHLCRRQAVPDAGHRGREAGLGPTASSPARAARTLRVGDKAGYIEHAAGECTSITTAAAAAGAIPSRARRESPEDVLDEYGLGRGRTARLRGRADGSPRGLTLAVDHAATERLRPRCARAGAPKPRRRETGSGGSAWPRARREPVDPRRTIASLPEFRFEHPLNPRSRSISGRSARWRDCSGWGSSSDACRPARNRFVYHSHRHEEEFLYVLAAAGSPRSVSRRWRWGPGTSWGSRPPRARTTCATPSTSTSST